MAPHKHATPATPNAGLEAQGGTFSVAPNAPNRCPRIALGSRRARWASMSAKCPRDSEARRDELFTYSDVWSLVRGSFGLSSPVRERTQRFMLMLYYDI